MWKVRANINLNLGDCMKAMKTMDDNQYDLAIVDVPYGIKTARKNNQSRGKARGGLNNSAMAYSKDYGISAWDDNVPSEEYFIQLSRVSKNQIIWGANHLGNMRKSSCWIVWDKDNGKNDFADCELAWTSFKTAVRKFLFRWHGLLQENMKNKEIRIHSCQKPVALYKWLLKNYAKPGDKILDTHAGSFSIGIACWDMKFDLEAFELDSEYYDKALERFDNHCKQQLLNI